MKDESAKQSPAQKKAQRRQANKDRIRNAYTQTAEVAVTPAIKTYSGDDNRILRVAAYCRVSTDSETQAISFELQRQEYENYIRKAENWTFIACYADEGLSGTSAAKRRQFQQMIQDCRNGKIDLILTKNVSRFMRNTVECLMYTRELNQLSPPVGIIFQTENIDTRKPGYEQLLTMYSLFAQGESENKSQAIKWSNERRWRVGIVTCNTAQFYGFETMPNGDMVIDPAEAKIVRKVFTKYLEGKNVRQIAQWLTTKRIPTYKGGEVWSETSVRNILKNEVYCGDVIRPKSITIDFLAHRVIRNKGQRDTYRRFDHHPAIIERAVWEEVQEQLKYRRCARSDTRKPLRPRRLSGRLGAFYLLDPTWDAYDLSRVRDKLLPPPLTKEEQNNEYEKETSPCTHLI